MAVPEQTPYIEYTANGVTTNFAVTFQCNSKDRLKVFINDIEQPSADWQFSGGNVVFNTPPIGGSAVSIERSTRLKRDTAYSSYDNSFRPEAINQEFDTLWHSAQEIELKNKNTEQKFQDLLDSIAAGNIAGLPAEILARIAADERLQTAINAEEARAYAAENARYTKTEVDSALALKAPQATTYTKAEVDTTFAAYVGGKKAYTTLALAQADQANLPANTAIEVTNDGTNNGTYQWNGTTLTKSVYDPLTQAKSYSDAKIENTQYESFLEVHKDFVGKTYQYVDRVGRIFVPFLSDSIQEEILQLNTKVSEQNNAQLLEVVDKNGNTVAVITSAGALYTNDFVTPSGSVNLRLDALEASKNVDDNANTLKYFDRTIASQDAEQVLINSSLISNTDIGMNEIFAPQIVRTARNKFVLFAEGRTGGDYGRIRLLCREITVNADLSVTKGEIRLIRDYGTDLNGKDYDSYNGAPLILDSGRILLFYVKRSILSHGGILTTYNYFTPYMIYSDDNGVTWSVEQEMRPFLSETPTVVLPTPANGIVLKHGVNKGRLIMPFYKSVVYTTETRLFKAFVMYSDDGGVTWQKGGESTHPYDTNESAIAENDDGTLLFLTRDISNFKSTEISRDGGLTFQDLNMRRTDIQTTVCQSGMIQVESSFDLSFPKLLMTTPSRADNTRFDLGLYGSYDNGKTWPVFKKLTDDSASYSALQVINERTLLVVYSANINRDIRAVIVNLKSIFLGA